MRRHWSRVRRPLVEVVGVAGAGKSTLAGGLDAGPDGSSLVGTLRTSEPRHLPSVLRGAPLAAAVAIAARRRGAPLSWVETKAALYLAGHDPVAHAARTGTGDPPTPASWVVVDQGPVYSLARLLVREEGVPAIEPGGRLWRRLLARSARLLDLVVVLHAPQDVLVRRIDGRDQDHEVKGAGGRAAGAFLTAYTEAYARVVTELAQLGVEVHRVDTGALGVDEVLAVVRDVLDERAATGARSEVET